MTFRIDIDTNRLATVTGARNFQEVLAYNKDTARGGIFDAMRNVDAANANSRYRSDGSVSQYEFSRYFSGRTIEEGSYEDILAKLANGSTGVERRDNERFWRDGKSILSATDVTDDDGIRTITYNDAKGNPTRTVRIKDDKVQVRDEATGNVTRFTGDNSGISPNLDDVRLLGQQIQTALDNENQPRETILSDDCDWVIDNNELVQNTEIASDGTRTTVTNQGGADGPITRTEVVSADGRTTTVTTPIDGGYERKSVSTPEGTTLYIVEEGDQDLEHARYRRDTTGVVTAQITSDNFEALKSLPGLIGSEITVTPATEDSPSTPATATLRLPNGATFDISGDKSVSIITDTNGRITTLEQKDGTDETTASTTFTYKTAGSSNQTLAARDDVDYTALGSNIKKTQTTQTFNGGTSPLTQRVVTFNEDGTAATGVISTRYNTNGKPTKIETFGQNTVTNIEGGNGTIRVGTDNRVLSTTIRNYDDENPAYATTIRYNDDGTQTETIYDVSSKQVITISKGADGTETQRSIQAYNDLALTLDHNTGVITPAGVPNGDARVVKPEVNPARLETSPVTVVIRETVVQQQPSYSMGGGMSYNPMMFGGGMMFNPMMMGGMGMMGMGGMYGGGMYGGMMGMFGGGMMGGMYGGGGGFGMSPGMGQFLGGSMLALGGFGIAASSNNPWVQGFGGLIGGFGLGIGIAGLFRA